MQNEDLPNLHVSIEGGKKILFLIFENLINDIKKIW